MADFPVVTALSRDECLALLSAVRVGRVAIHVGALPAIRTVRFSLTAAHVVFRVAPQSALCRGANGVVAFQADHYDHDRGLGWCVEVVGHSRQVTDPETLVSLRALPLEPWAPGDQADHFFRVGLDSVKGQRVRLPAAT